MPRFFARLPAAAVTAVLLLVSPVLAQFPPLTDPTANEARCQATTGRALGMLVGSTTRCIQKCIATHRRTDGLYAGCLNLLDPTTRTCVLGDPVPKPKGAEPNATAAIVKGCAKDCPECYGAIDANICSIGQPFALDTEGFGEFVVSSAHCVEASGATPTRAEAKCEDTVAQAIPTFWNAMTKCYQKCVANEIKGRIAPGSCLPPVPSDAATQACLFDPVKGATAKAVLKIDKACEPSMNPQNQKPACFSSAGFVTGSSWVDQTKLLVDASIPRIWCSDPPPAPLPLCCSYPPAVIGGIFSIPARCDTVPVTQGCPGGASSGPGVCRNDGTCGAATGPGDCCSLPASSSDACTVFTSSTSTLCSSLSGTFAPNTVCTVTGCQ